MVQAGQNLAFGRQAIVVCYIDRHLQDEVFVARVIVDEKRIAG